ncbi:MAG TPA: O-antigen ligase family protein [Bryobacteraceae bacterium]|nr:O-antigen ligase family protein [Bryobacteraceae bacterium]
MIPSAGSRDRRELWIGLALGLYATAVALTPGIVLKAALCAPLIVIPISWRLLATSTAWLTLFFACALLAPPLPIRLGDSGPHVALLIAGAGLFIGFLRLPEWRFRADLLGRSMLAIWFVFACSVTLAALYSGPTVAAGSLARVLLFGISIYIFLYVRDGPFRMRPEQEFRAIRFLFWAGILSALFACVDFYFQFPTPAGYEQQFIWLDTGVYRRAQGVFYEASTLGNLCAFFLEMIAVAMFRPRQGQPFSRLELFLGGGALATALVLSFSRASLVNLAVALVVLLWLHRQRIHWRRLIISVLFFGASAGAILQAAFPAFTGMAWLRFFNALRYFSESPNTVLSGRVASWQTLVNFLASNPWHAPLGVGYKTLPYSDFIGATAVGDNTYLTLLVETGIVGLAAVIVLNCAILVYALRAARSASPLRSFCGTWMACFWAGQVVQMFSADLLTYWRVLPVYFFVLALAVREEAQ